MQYSQGPGTLPDLHREPSPGQAPIGQAGLGLPLLLLRGPSCSPWPGLPCLLLGIPIFSPSQENPHGLFCNTKERCSMLDMAAKGRAEEKAVLDNRARAQGKVTSATACLKAPEAPAGSHKSATSQVRLPVFLLLSCKSCCMLGSCCCVCCRKTCRPFPLMKEEK